MVMMANNRGFLNSDMYSSAGSLIRDWEEKTEKKRIDRMFMRPEERNKEEQRDREALAADLFSTNFTETPLEVGVLLGGVGGAAVGGALGHTERTVGLVIGTVLGAVFGGLTGIVAAEDDLHRRCCTQ